MKKTDVLYQVALLQSLVQGSFDGFVTVRELREHGDTGIGTFDGVNGEMIVLDGVVYQALADGSVALPSGDETIPFGDVTFFEADETLKLGALPDMASLKAALDGAVKRLGANCLYMVKLEGRFSSIKVRSVCRQKKPYRALDVALAADQTEFDYEDVCGTLVGLCCPDYLGGLNTTDCHFHFLSEDRSRGGHVLQLAVREASALLDQIGGFEMRLSRSESFQQLALAKNVDEAICRAENAAREDK